MESNNGHATPLRQWLDEAFRKDLEVEIERLRTHYGLADAAVAWHLADLVTWYGVAFSLPADETKEVA